MPKYKDWNEDIKASYNLIASLPEEHPQYILRDEIYLEIINLTSELNEIDIIDQSVLKLNNVFYNCRKDNTEQMVESLKQLSALSLLVAKKEYREMGSNQDINILQQRLYYGFKAYENRIGLNNRLDMIGQELLKISKYQGIVSETEKLSIAKSYEVIAQHSLKSIILIELQDQKQEQKQLKEMTM